MRLVPVFLAVALLAGCTSAKPDVSPSPGPPTTLRVLAGSELADMQPILDEAAKATGVTVKMDFIGSLEGAEAVATGKADGKYDAVWFSSDRYLETIPEAKKRLGTATRIMGSPVVLGVRAEAARRLGWTGAVTWKDIAAAAARGDFTFAMTDPASSNTGFSALVEVATALDGSGRALDDAAINRVAAPLTGFFSGQRLTAGSSGWLSDTFVEQGSALDALVTYEASLVELNRSGKLKEPLTIVYPAEGVVSADYPLTLLTGATTAVRDAHERLGDYLRTAAVQQRIGELTARRPAVPGIALPSGLPVTPVELPFPSTRPAVDGLLTAYQDRLRRPSRTVYVLDVSGSMKGTRIASLKTALAGLTGVNTSLTGTYCRFRSREEVTLLPFSDRPKAPVTVTVDAANPQPSRDRLRGAVDQLKVGGGTAVYDSLVAAYQSLDAARDKDRFVSIVLMTDGESNRGSDLAAFKKYLSSRGAAQRVAVFPIMLGEAAEAQMNDLATATGGAVWDARNADLTKAFCQIRGYQ
ncbi:substrate-binding and vWA domain-containing protein [Actinoplanes sp. HUAS TT8]|uniref:substrate-binding and vWA domain-containing protein n=1 Tax=Actinoplanes sp. HUAS TT8 TaxID=3447453 RepID=UPI003F5208D1